MIIEGKTSLEEKPLDSEDCPTKFQRASEGLRTMPDRSSITKFVVALVVAVSAPTSLGMATAAAQATYTLIDLGSTEATSEDVADCAYLYAGRAFAINTSGQVTGATAFSDRPAGAFRATDGSIKRLKSGKGGGIGADINSSGQVAGGIFEAGPGKLCEGAGPSHAATWIGGELTLLPENEARTSYAIAINEDGVIVGRLTADVDQNGAIDTTPAVWRDGEVEELPLPDGIDGFTNVVAIDINGSGQILGTVRDIEAKPTGSVLWEDGKPTRLPEGFIAAAINDDGVIVGSTDDGTGAARLVEGELEKLSGVPDDAVSVTVAGINADGDVVGSIGVPGDDETTTFLSVLWQDDEMIDLSEILPTDVGYDDVSPVDINDGGMILGYGVTVGEPSHIVILVPDER